MFLCKRNNFLTIHFQKYRRQPCIQHSQFVHVLYKGEIVFRAQGLYRGLYLQKYISTTWLESLRPFSEKRPYICEPVTTFEQTKGRILSLSSALCKKSPQNTLNQKLGGFLSWEEIRNSSSIEILVKCEERKFFPLSKSQLQISK